MPRPFRQEPAILIAEAQDYLREIASRRNAGELITNAERDRELRCFMVKAIVIALIGLTKSEP